MSKDTTRQILNSLSVVIALTVDILASALPLNGENTREISDRFQVYLVRAGYVFAIWFFIYIRWIAFAIYQFRSSQKESPRLRRLGYLFALSGIANSAWLFAWHYNVFGVSVLIMLILLGQVIASYLRLDVNRRSAKGAEWWSVDLPFSIYLGWITVATVANITSWLYSILVYFSELVEEAGLEYGRRARSDPDLAPLDSGGCASQRAAVLSGFRPQDPGRPPRVATYDIREFVY